ncbi:hypothetical protein WJX81_006256 [Elliptochloris bilobata]|uniref:Uncharacterized protein n=1 Tax=Elliptochloris bilobata TaxID=381761 RepID=A0AAW1QJQ7_9CHLO
MLAWSFCSKTMAAVAAAAAEATRAAAVEGIAAEAISAAAAEGPVLKSVPVPDSDPEPPTPPVPPPNPANLGLAIVVTQDGGYAFLDGDLLWWFYVDSSSRQTVRGYWSSGCMGCGVFRTQDGRVRCPAGSFLSAGSCRKVRAQSASNSPSAPVPAPPKITDFSWDKPLSCAGCASQPVGAVSRDAPAHKPMNLTELPVPAALASVYGLNLSTNEPPEGGVSFTYRGRIWWYFTSPAASGGSITTYGFWEDKNRSCFGCGYFFEYNTGKAACPIGYFLDPRKFTTCTKLTRTQAH